MRLLLFLLVLSAINTAWADTKRVITLGGALTEVVYALGAEAALVGNDTTSYYPPEAETLPKVGYQRALSAEGILSLKPDLVIHTPDAGPPSVLKQLKSAGVELVKVPVAESVPDVQQTIIRVGEALGKTEAAKELAQQIANEYKAYTEMLDDKRDTKRVVFIMQHGRAAPMVAGTETAADKMIQLAGVENAVAEFSGYKPLTPESVIQFAPDVIITTKEALELAGSVEAFLQTPGLVLTPAGKAQRVIAMDTLYLLGFGPRTVEAAKELHQRINAFDE